MTRARAPLEGLRVVVTRAADDAAVLVSRLEALGAVPLLCPSIEFGPAHDLGTLDAALGMQEADWVVFTSARGVHVALERARDAGIEAPAWSRARVAAIGPATAAALEASGVAVDFVPDEFVGEALAASLPDVAGRCVLLLRAQQGNDVLREHLVRRRARVLDVAAYTTGPAALAAETIDELRAGFDAVTFTAASTVDHFVALLGDGAGARLPDTAIVTIGPVTSDAVRAHGLRVSAEARSATLDGLVDALVAHFCVTAA